VMCVVCAVCVCVCSDGVYVCSRCEDAVMCVLVSMCVLIDGSVYWYDGSVCVYDGNALLL
jgi:hypothetical protein